MFGPRRGAVGSGWRRGLVVLLATLAAPALAADGPLKTFTYAGEGSLKAAYGDLRFLVDVASTPDDRKNVRLRGFDAGKPAFAIKFDVTSPEEAKARVELVTLAADAPQVVFQHFSGGAHCCTETQIAVRRQGAWTVVAGDTLDGDGGYGFADIDGSGTQELLGHDDSFLYAFSSYAESVAPLKIERLEGSRLVDVSADPRFQAAIRKSLAELEDADRDGEARFDSNGFLAGWVATKILAGEGAAAWARMLTSYDKDPETAPQLCEDRVPLETCRDDRRRNVGFPEALRAHLLTHGYIKSVADYPLPPAGAGR